MERHGGSLCSGCQYFEMIVSDDDSEKVISATISMSSLQKKSEGISELFSKKMNENTYNDLGPRCEC